MRIMTVCIGMLLAGCTHAPDTISPQQPGPPPDLVIRNGTLIDGTGAPPRQTALIEIRDGRVANIIEEGEPVIAPGVPVIDATGKFIMPGLADMHVHFGPGGLGPATPPSQERLLRQFVFYGVTSVLSVGGTGGSVDAITDFRSRAAAGAIVAPHIYATGGSLTLPGSHPVGTVKTVPEGEDPETYDWSEQGVEVVATIPEAVGTVRAHAAAGMDAIKIIVESGPEPYGDDHPQMPVEMIAAIVEAADDAGIPVVAHVSSLDELENSLEGSVRALIHGVGGTPLPGAEHWNIMREKDIYYVPTISLYAPMITDRWIRSGALNDPFLRAGVDQSTLESLRGHEPSAQIPAPVKQKIWSETLASFAEAHASGVPVAAGTDTNMPFVFPGFSVHEELEFLVEAGLTPSEAITAATLRAAELIGKEDEFGTIETGKRADLLILKNNPLDDITNTRSLETVILEGEPIDRDALLH